MRYALKDYQTRAVGQVLRRLERAQQDTRAYGGLSAFALSATTGAGKTVMATAVIEALFHGSEELDFAPASDERAQDARPSTATGGARGNW